MGRRGLWSVKRENFWQVLFSSEVPKSAVLADILDPSFPGAFPLRAGGIFQKSPAHTHTLVCIPKICGVSKHSGIRVTPREHHSCWDAAGWKGGSTLQPEVLPKAPYTGMLFCPAKRSVKSRENMPTPAASSVHSCAYSSRALPPDR